MYDRCSLFYFFAYPDACHSATYPTHISPQHFLPPLLTGIPPGLLYSALSRMATDEQLAVRIIGADGPVAELEPDMLAPPPAIQLVVAIRSALREPLYVALPADLHVRLMTSHNYTAHGRDCVGIPACFTSSSMLVLYQCAVGEKKGAQSRYESIWY